MPMTQEERELLAALEAQKATAFEEEEGQNVRKAYEEEYNKALSKTFKPSIVRQEPNESQKEFAKAQALDALSSRYKKEVSAIESEKPKAEVKIPLAAPDIEFPKVENIQQAIGQLKILKGEAPGAATEETIRGRRPTIDKTQQAELRFYNQIEKAKDTPANREAIKNRQKELESIISKATKYTPENLKRLIESEKPGPVTEPTGKSAVTEAATAEEEPAAPEAEEKPAAPTVEKERPAKEPTKGNVEASINKAANTAEQTSDYLAGLDLTPQEKDYFKGVEERLSNNLKTAKDAYKKGVDRIELMKTIEKIAEGLALFGAGMYGKKHGIDAVSGLKFSPTDWSDRMKALEKELDIEEKRYTTGIERAESEKERLQKYKEKKLDKQQLLAQAAQKLREEQASKLARATESGLKRGITDTDNQVAKIDAALQAMATTKFSDMDAEQKELQLDVIASTLGVEKEELRTEVGWLFKNNEFDPNKARELLKARKEKLLKHRMQLDNKLYQVQSGQEVSAPAPQATRLTPEDEAKIAKLAPELQAELWRLEAKAEAAKKERSGK